MQKISATAHRNLCWISGRGGGDNNQCGNPAFLCIVLNLCRGSSLCSFKQTSSCVMLQPVSTEATLRPLPFGMSRLWHKLIDQNKSFKKPSRLREEHNQWWCSKYKLSEYVPWPFMSSLFPVKETSQYMH